ncbi:MAG: EF-P lysine aminoacylase EpmA [Aquirhabdus sp.]
MSASVSLEALRAREVLYQNVRDFFSSQKIVEVETTLFPLNISAHQSSVFQVGKQHRDEPTDRRHRTEFSVLQWIQPDWTNEQILSDIDTFLMAIFAGEFEPERRTFRQAFIQRLGFDPEELTAADLRQEARRLGLNVSLGEDRLAWLKLMFVNFIEPTLGIDIPLYLMDLPCEWRDTKYDGNEKFNSSVDVYIDGIKVGSVLSIDGKVLDDQQQMNAALNIVFGLDRLLMIILETRQIEKVVGI